MGLYISCSSNLCTSHSELICTTCKSNFCYPCSILHLSHNPGHTLKFTEIQDPFFQDLFLISLRYATKDNGTHLLISFKSPKFLAIKIQLCPSDEILNKIQEEATLIRSLNHPNICKCLKSYIYSSKSGCKILIVMEYCEIDMEEEILNRLIKKKHFSEPEILEYSLQLIQAFGYMQEMNLAHRDVKPANLLLNGKNLKIADFGLGIQTIDVLRTGEQKCVGTLAYLSPILKEHFLASIETGKNLQVRHNPFKSDVYSLGLTILHMCTLIQPSLNCGPNLELRIENSISKLKYSVFVKNLIKSMLIVTEPKRMDFIQLSKLIKSGEWIIFKPTPETGPCEPQNTKNKSLTRATSEISISDRSTFCSTSDKSTFCTTRNESVRNDSDPVIFPTITNKIGNFRAFFPLTPNKCSVISGILHEFDLFELDLEGSLVDQAGLNSLIKGISHKCNLKALNLGKNPLGVEGGITLGKGLPSLHSIKILRVFNCALGNEGTMWIFKGIQYLTELYLSDNRISMLSFLNGNMGGLEVLSLTHNMVGDEGAKIIGLEIKSSKINSLYLGNNGISNIGAEALVKGAKDKAVKINLKNNLVSDDIRKCLISTSGRLTIFY